MLICQCFLGRIAVQLLEIVRLEHSEHKKYEDKEYTWCKVQDKRMNSYGGTDIIIDEMLQHQFRLSFIEIHVWL